MPIDINYLRAYKTDPNNHLVGNVDLFKASQAARFKDPSIVDTVIALDSEWRDTTSKIMSLKQDVNTLQKTVIAPAKKAKENCEAALSQVQELKGNIKELEDKLPELVAARTKMLSKIGNIVDPEVPISKNEDDNLVVSLHPLPTGVSLPLPIVQVTCPTPPKKPLTHDELLWRIGGYEPTRGSNVAGHRGYFLKNAGVLLNQAIINFGISFLGARGYDVLQPPFFMNKDVMSGIAQLEDFDEQLYKVQGKTDDPTGESEKYLIATSEQPICAYHKDDWLDIGEPESELPKRYAGISTCFRKEAGSSGKDIRGIFRVHQFEKIEQFCIVKDDIIESASEQKRMITAAEDFYKALGLSYRVVCLVSGELNDAAIKKYDLEGWFPGQDAYRELVSCSNCTDYQSRSMEIRCGMKKPDQTCASYVHMLNSTLCATGRGICCVLESYQTEDGVIVPDMLKPYMGGLEFLPFVRGPMAVAADEKKVNKPPPAQKK